VRAMSRAILLAALLASACASEEVDLGGNYEVTLVIPPMPNPAIDILFVVDNSGSTSDKQAQIAAHAKEALFDVIGTAVGGQPDLHVGVITTDMATAISLGDANCSDSDEGELLLGDPDVPDDCPEIDGRYIVDIDDGAGGRITNYTGTLEEAFGCAVRVGRNGCGFEQPLASLAAALDNPANAGFLRPDALLVTVIIADEDDCSSTTHDFFGPENEERGPIDSYRCFQSGVVCVEPLDDTGVKTDCHAIEDPWNMEHVAGFRDLLIAAKGDDPTKVIVATITGESTPIEVGRYSPMGATQDRLTLLPSCSITEPSGDSFVAYPALRLDAFRDLFLGMSWSDTLCVPTEDALARTANMVGDVAGRRACLRGELRDGDAETAGTQPVCRAFLATAALTPAEARREVPRCEADGTSCFEIEAGSATCSQWSGLEIKLRGITQAGNESLIVECQRPQTP
jgi:hypothetical protein